MESGRVICGVVLTLSVCLCGVTGVSAEQGPTTLQLLARIELLEKQGQEQERTVQEQGTRLHLQEQTVQELREVVQQQDDHNTRQDARVAELQTRVSQHERTIASLTALLKEGGKDQTNTPSPRQGDNSRSPVTSKRSLQQDDVTADVTGADGAGDVELRRHEEQAPLRPTRIVMDARGVVAFQVKMNRPELHLGLNQNVRFDAIVTNLGGGYHANHGLFIAPAAGIYIFSTSVLAGPGKGILIEVGIEKNGQEIAGAYATSAESGHDQGAVTVVTELAVSDEVWVMVRMPQSEAVVSGYSFSSFMGCLVLPFDAYA